MEESIHGELKPTPSNSLVDRLRLIPSVRSNMDPTEAQSEPDPTEAQSEPHVISPVPRSAAELRLSRSLAGQGDGVGARAAARSSNAILQRSSSLRARLVPAPGSGSPDASSRPSSASSTRDASSPLSSKSTLPSRPASTPVDQYRPASTPVDQHEKYRCKAHATVAKLRQIFGDLPPVDISVAEIEKEGLKALLQSRAPMCYFLYALLRDHCSENLFFFLEIEHYQTCKFASDDQMHGTAARIFEAYLSHNSYLEVNVDDCVRQNVAKALESKTSLPMIFDASRNAVVVLMEGSFLKFTKSPVWNRMVEELGRGNFHSPRTRHKAVAILRDFVHEQPSSPAPGNAKDDFLPNCSFGMQSGAGSNDCSDPRMRHELVVGMVKDFCLKVAKVDITNESVFQSLNDEDESKRRKRTWERYRLSLSICRSATITSKSAPMPSEYADSVASKQLLFSLHCRPATTEGPENNTPRMTTSSL